MEDDPATFFRWWSLNCIMRAHESLYYKTVVSFFVAHLVVLHGRSIPIFSTYREDNYLPSTALAMGICLVCWELVRRINRNLNTQYDWFTKPSDRFALQLIYGIFIPSVFMIALLIGQIALVYGTSMFTSQTVVSELVIACSFVLMVNLVYFVSSLIFRIRQTREIMKREFPWLK